VKEFDSGGWERDLADEKVRKRIPQARGGKEKLSRPVRSLRKDKMGGRGLWGKATIGLQTKGGNLEKKRFSCISERKKTRVTNLLFQFVGRKEGERQKTSIPRSHKWSKGRAQGKKGEGGAPGSGNGLRVWGSVPNPGSYTDVPSAGKKNSGYCRTQMIKRRGRRSFLPGINECGRKRGEQ